MITTVPFLLFLTLLSIGMFCYGLCFYPVSRLERKYALTTYFISLLFVAALVAELVHP